MKKLTLIILCFLIPSVYAWGWNTHQKLAGNIYFSFPLELQLKLNLTLIEEGSIAPDKVFRDNVNHHYPKTINLSLKWINLTKYYLSKNNYNNASYSFGVLTHYISDSFVAPHYIYKEDPKLHSKFESQVKEYKQKTKCNNNIISITRLSEGSENKKDWELWLLSKDPLIPQEESEEAQAFLYSISMNLFNISCFESKTNIEYSKLYLSPSVIITMILISILIFLLLIDLFKN